VDFELLSDVLKNPIRRKIIFSLSDRGRISYVDLMNSVDVANTGKFNYR
jgi:predicted transcriptional regulator